MINSSSGNCGSDRNRSVSHIRAASTLPREIPAIAPTIVPTPPDTARRTPSPPSAAAPPNEGPAEHTVPNTCVPKRVRQGGPARGGEKSYFVQPPMPQQRPPHPRQPQQPENREPAHRQP